MTAQLPSLVIYGTGQFGQYITRFAVEKGWPIVAAFNRAGDKIGQDLGRLAGLDHDIGVLVEDCDLADFSSIDADIGVVTMTNQLAQNMPAYTRLMQAGLNVICHGTEAYYPYGNNADLAAQIDALATENNVTFSGSGIWDMSRIWSGILLAGTCTDIRSLIHTSLTDCSRIGKAGMMFTGVGLTPEGFTELSDMHRAVFSTYKTIPEQVLSAIGYTVTETNVTIEPIVTDDPVPCDLLGRPVAAGECIGVRILTSTLTGEGIQADAHIELRLFQPDEVEHMHWTVDGQPVSSVRTEREDSAHATAACLFNRIPDVIAARPGIVLISEMGPMVHTGLVRAPK